ncbi:hypothetical protein PG990_000079 [Apiospora arundinis]
MANKVTEAAEKDRDAKLALYYARMRLALRPLAAELLAEAAVVLKWSEAEPGDTNAMGANLVMAETVAVVVLGAFGRFIWRVWVPVRDWLLHERYVRVFCAATKVLSEVFHPSISCYFY